MRDAVEKHQAADLTPAPTAAQVLATQFPNREFSVPLLIGRGVVSAVYRADSDGESFAVKLHAADRNSISQYEREEYERERRWAARAAAAGIPCPQVLAIGWHGNIAYSIQTFVAGVNGLEAPVNPLAIWKELGRLARLIHSIPVEDAEAKWRLYVASILAGLTEDDMKITLGLYAAHQQDDLRRVFQKLGALPLRYGLNHCDLHPKNTVVTPEGRIFLLDWGAASRDINVVPHAELASLLWGLDVPDERFRAFIAGYGLSETEFHALLPEVLALDLIGCFWFSETPPRSEFGHALVAHAKRQVAEHLPRLAHWASR